MLPNISSLASLDRHRNVDKNGKGADESVNGGGSNCECDCRRIRLLVRQALDFVNFVLTFFAQSYFLSCDGNTKGLKWCCERPRFANSLLLHSLTLSLLGSLGVRGGKEEDEWNSPSSLLDGSRDACSGPVTSDMDASMTPSCFRTVA